MGKTRFRVGDLVEIRSKEEILATLDNEGCRESLPFMPEMFKLCGTRARISASAHKTCDTINKTGGRRMNDAFHLDSFRCDGEHHGGCQAECLLFWKTAWLKHVEKHESVTESSPVRIVGADLPLTQFTSHHSVSGSIRYRCQATQLFDATSPLAWWDVRQYLRDVRTGNVTLAHALSTLLLSALYKLTRMPTAYRATRWLYDRAHRLFRGRPDPHFHGQIPRGHRTPSQPLDLQVGEVVEVRSKSEIESTINPLNRNRGLNIDEEQTIYCGGTYRVRTIVSRIINEQSGEMMHFKNPCIVLDGADCRGEYSAKRLLCPRRITTYWREIWLRRISEEHDKRIREVQGTNSEQLIQ